MSRPLRVFISAGETSGDRFGAKLVEAIRHRRPDTVFRGLGGPRMAAQGVELIEDLTGHSVIGLLHVIAKLGFFWKVFRRCKANLRDAPPDALVPIDNPGFNLRLAAFARGLGVPVVYYVSPQVWAWRRGRIHRIGAIVDRMLCILPFEKALYDKIGCDARYVGHPALDYLAEASLDPEAEERVRGMGDRVIGLLPGSRDQEIKQVFPIIAGTAAAIQKESPGTRFVVGCAEHAHEQPVRAALDAAGVEDAVLLTGKALEIMRASYMCIATSGTVTLELAYFRRPMVIVYRAPWPGRFLFRWVLHTHFGLINVIAGKEICPEFLRFSDDPGPVVDAALRLLRDEDAWETQRVEIGKAMELMGKRGASERAAEAVLGIAEGKSGQ